ncbi:MAG: ATP-binding protein [Bacteroidales bacterium]|nr:ATP-binding protein [Bacteroidales bacterium]
MLIGREKEQKILKTAFNSDESQFVAVYGRRRVGKTYLVRQFFKGKLTFAHSGQAKGSMPEQLFGWCSSLREAGLKFDSAPKNWLEAFELLKDLVRQSSDKKKVIFIDEMPWLDTPRSNFTNALESFWNGWASNRDDILLIVCGSATSWIVNKLFKNHGGLHNRVTYRILVVPFTLHECEMYIEKRGIKLTRYDILETYMIMGGIPFYWSLLERGKSVAQNIDDLFFAKNGSLKYEFQELYQSLFKNPDYYVNIVQTLGTSRTGMTRDEIINACRLPSSGTVSNALDDLEHCGFISKTPSYNLKNRAKYCLIDNYTLFYMKFIKNSGNNDEHFWSDNYKSGLHNAWVGLAFERVCFQHIPQIKSALGISGVHSQVYTWQTGPSKDGFKGAQIDMLIDRADNMVNICEMKFSKIPYTVSNDDSVSIANKVERFSQAIGNSKSINVTLITVSGIAEAGHWNDIHSIVTADGLFLSVK